MQLLYLLTVIMAFSIAEAAPHEPVDASGLRLAGAVAGVVVVALVALVFALVTSRRIRRSPNSANCLRWFARMRTVHSALWVTVACATLSTLGWTRLVRWNWDLDRVFLADELLVLLPVVAPMILSWAAFFEVDRALAAVCPSAGLPPIGRWKYVVLHARHYFGLLLLPVLCALAVDDAWRLLGSERLLSETGVASSAGGVWVVLPMMGLLAVGLPVALRIVWPMRSLADCPLRRRLEESLRLWKTPARNILVWQTGGRAVNAAIAGFVAPLRYVILTDGLLAHLDDDEIEAVCAHEAGHIRHRHLLLRALVVVLPLAMWNAALAIWPAAQHSLEATLSSLGLSQAAQAGLLTPAAIGLYAWFIFGPYCRFLEYQADLFACCVDRPSQGDDPSKPHEPWRAPVDSRRRNRSVECNAPSPDAVVCFQTLLGKLAASGGLRNRTWLHPAIDARGAFLDRMLADPSALGRFHLRARLLARLMVLATAASAMIALVAS